MRYGNHDRAVNWNHLREIVEERGWSGADFSLRMGKSKSWLAGSVKDDRKVTDTMLTQMEIILSKAYRVNFTHASLIYSKRHMKRWNDDKM